MDFEKLSARLKGFVQSAQTLAVREGNPQITPEHLLKVLLDDPEGLAAGLIKRAGGNPKQALEKTEAALAKLPRVSGGGAAQPHMAAALARVLDQADPSEVLVSSIVKDLVVGSGLEFAERGSHELRGIPGEWSLFSVT